MAAYRWAALAVGTTFLTVIGCATSQPPAVGPTAGVADAGSVSVLPRQLVTVKVAGLRSAADGPVYIAYEKGYFREQGIDLDLAALADTNEMVPLLAQGHLHVGSSSVAASLFNAIARGVPLKLVADKSHRRPGESVAAGWAVRKDLLDSGQVRGPADFRGRVIGLGSRGAQGEMELDIILARGGLQLDEVELRDVRYADQIAAFANGSIDIAYTFEPYSVTLRS